MKPPKHVLISRTDSIGDVVLTLPMAQYLKNHFPDIRISFLGRGYTRAVVEAYEAVDAFILKEDFLEKSLFDKPDMIVHVLPDKQIAERSRKLGIAQRVGTTNRLFHWWTCNRLVKLSRKKSDLHEAQLNIKLLKPLGINTVVSIEELTGMLQLKPQVVLPEEVAALLEGSKRKIILHPKSQGSAREWGFGNFKVLARELNSNGVQVFISGTANEQEALEPLLQNLKDIATSVVGKMDLETFIAFIDKCDGLVAASTGPLHIAGALGKAAVGIYPSQRPMHSGRWGVLGRKAVSITARQSGIDNTTLNSVTPIEVWMQLQERLR